MHRLCGVGLAGSAEQSRQRHWEGPEEISCLGHSVTKKTNLTKAQRSKERLAQGVVSGIYMAQVNLLAKKYN